MTSTVMNTCFLVAGVSESNCASWVQAWGSVVAIFVAIAVAWHQSNRAEEQHRATERQRVEDTFGPPIAIISAAVQFFEMTFRPLMLGRLAGKTVDYGASDKPLILGLVDALNEFPAHTLGEPGAVQAVMRARSLLSAVTHMGLELAEAPYSQFPPDPAITDHEINDFNTLIEQLVHENNMLDTVRKRRCDHG
jgi:hypothetical protein